MRRLVPLAFQLALVALAQSCGPLLAQNEAGLAPLRQEAGAPITCSKGDDCEVRWSRALQWVTTTSRWKLRTATDTVIQTEGPFDTTDAAFTVQKIALGQDRYQIALTAGCGSVFGCVPDVLELRVSFKRFVAPDQPATEPPRHFDHTACMTDCHGHQGTDESCRRHCDTMRDFMAR